MAERADDLLDLERQVLLELSGGTPQPLALGPGSIVLADDLRVMDATAIVMCRDNNLPLVVFGSTRPASVASRGADASLLVAGRVEPGDG